MLFLDGGLGLLFVVLWLFCLFDVITTDASLCRNLSKPVWLVIVLLLPDIGSILWLVAGRPQRGYGRPGGLPYKGNYGRDAHASLGRSQSRLASNPDDDEAFMRQVRERAQRQRSAVPPPVPPTELPRDDQNPA